MNLLSGYHTYRKMLFGATNSFRRYILYTLTAFAILMMSWEASYVDAAIAGQAIPEQSIRLRILANSDSPADQLLKRQVRDAVVEQFNTWVTEPDDIEQARESIEANLPQIEQLVRDTMSEYGYSYDVSVELGTVDFPAKLYGNQVYPAGEYEALRISIGEAQGQNWWCVLFPPLCFVDMVSGGSEPVAYASETDEESDATESTAEPESVEKKSEVAAASVSMTQANPQEVETRFFLWDLLQGVLSWIGSLF